MNTRLPEQLRIAIEHETGKIERRALRRAVAELTELYQARDHSTPILPSEAHRAAYLAVRLPATYAACRRVFEEIRRLAPEARTTSVLDLGAGPGTALWAAADAFPNAGQATAVDCDAAWLKLAKRLAAEGPYPLLAQAQWRAGDLVREENYPQHDLVIVSYALGELSPSDREALVRRAWNSAAQFLVIVEAGTPRGFSSVHSARETLIAACAKILAPCPNRLACPMAAAGDWCHFSQRVERTSLHRQLKGATLAYEDEKFSYLVASRDYASSGLARLVRHPHKNPGHVQLRLCSAGQIEARTVARSQKEAYKLARRAEWGETWKGPPLP
ncbi:MAG TPA: small ribosomal subunit Rsm22 family protein [Terriglobia bacterium]